VPCSHETPDGETYCYHFDATGHTIALTDMSMNMPNAYAYDPYGNITKEQEGIVQPFKYAGQFGVMAEANGFYYMKARYYDPQVGRFISEDPIGFEGGDTNLYAYVGGNPVMGVDPSGEVVPGLVAVGLFVGAKALAAGVGYGVTKGTAMLAGWVNGNYAETQAEANRAIATGAVITGGQTVAAGAIGGGVQAAGPAVTYLLTNPATVTTFAVNAIQRGSMGMSPI
jgi:RHS repeat-associated protein